MDDDLFWRSTPYEVAILMDEFYEVRKRRARQAALNAGLVTSAIYNVNRKKGTRPFKPEDFIRREPKKLSPEQMRDALNQWADGINRRHEA